MEDTADTLPERLRRRVGSTLRGKYVLERVLGAGGMAAVYRARHRNGNVVAIKILHPALSLDDEMRQRFRREALLANRVDHPGAVHVLDDDVSEDGCAFLVMPLLRGETLRARWEREGRVLPVREVLVMARALLDVLAAAHAERVVHRDVKPDNVFVTDDGELRVLDFGVARLLEGPDSPWATATGRAVGTPAFMAPEQAIGRTRDIDERTDLWAVGATMFTCLSGAHVHEGSTGGELLVHAATRPAPHLQAVMPDVDGALARVVDRALAFDKADRWTSAREMQGAVAAAFEAMRCDPPLEGARLSVTRPRDERDDDGAPPADIHALATAKGSIALPATSATIAGKPRGSTPRRGLWVGAAVVAAAAAVALQRAGSDGARVDRVAAAASARELPPEVAQAVAASRRAWLDADFRRALEEARKATAKDDLWAAPHLAALVAMPFWPDDETRTHFVRAQELRDQLGPADRDLLAALAPAVTVPPDFRRSAELLDAVVGKSPDDVVARITTADMWFRIGELDRAAALLAPLAAGDDPAAMTLSELGAVQGSADRIDDARVTLVRCTERYPAARACSVTLSWIELLEGRCSEAEKIVRREVSLAPSASGYDRLAQALWGMGVSPAELRPVLDKWAALSTGARQRLNPIRADRTFALLTGRIGEALEADAKLEKELVSVDDDAERFDYTLSRMLLEAETGARAAAASTLDAYVASRHGLRQTAYGGDNVMYLEAIGAELGLVPWAQWLKLRDAKLAQPSPRDGLVDGLARTWLEYYALPATTAGAAKEALAVLPKYPPVLNRSERHFWHDGAIARVYALAGRPADAVPYFERAVKTCNALDDPLKYERVLVDYGAFLENAGDKDRACAIYERALHAFPLGPKSESVQRADRRRGAVCRGG
jgi:serine/threonine-protein kinase